MQRRTLVGVRLLVVQALKLNDPGQGAVDVWRDSAGRPGIGVKREEVRLRNRAAAN